MSQANGAVDSVKAALVKRGCSCFKQALKTRSARESSRRPDATAQHWGDVGLSRRKGQGSLGNLNAGARKACWHPAAGEPKKTAMGRACLVEVWTGCGSALKIIGDSPACPASMLRDSIRLR